MLFNSYFFTLVFLPLILAAWWLPRLSIRSRLAVLIAASYMFYGWWDYRFVTLLVFSTLVDFTAGHRIYASSTRSWRTFWLSVSLTANLGLLLFFKYCGFFAASWNAVVSWAHFGGQVPVLAIILPVGISFYTFQTMSYSIDIYRGSARPALSLFHFAAYVALFPQLIAGPIIRYGEIEQQLRTIRSRVCWRQLSLGIWFFVAGMCQKVLLADTIASRVDPLLLQYEDLRFFGTWFCMLGYTCQLYFDFAGYSNMAVGLGFMLGFEFPQNFDSPYKSANISEFWRRWHMTLSFWLRDYLFVPLGGSRLGHWRTLRNLIVVMALGGLWHGAGWTFVLWGLYHGALLAGHSCIRQTGWFRVSRHLSVAVTFCAVLFGWVLFRSADMGMCRHLMAALLGMQGIESSLLTACGGRVGIGLLALLLAIIFVAPNVWQIRPRRTPAMAFGLSAALALCVLRFSQESPFLYFQF